MVAAVRPTRSGGPRRASYSLRTVTKAITLPPRRRGQNAERSALSSGMAAIQQSRVSVRPRSERAPGAARPGRARPEAQSAAQTSRSGSPSGISQGLAWHMTDFASKQGKCPRSSSDVRRDRRAMSSLCNLNIAYRV